MCKGFDRITNRILKGLSKQLKRYPVFFISKKDSSALVVIIDKIRVSLK